MKLSQIPLRLAAAVAAFSALAFASAPALAQIDRSQPVRILALGDSNTAGSSNDSRPEGDSQWGGYRNELRRLLLQSGYQVDFVGLLNRFSTRMQNSEHEGWYGAPIEFLTSEVAPRAMVAYDPDLVLLMAGSNNFWRNPSAPVSDFIARYEELLTALFAADPEVDVIVYFSGMTKAGSTGPETVRDKQGSPITPYGIPITPAMIYWSAKFHWERYSLPIVISENGLPLIDWGDNQGRIMDFGRIDFMRRYLAHLECAMQEQIPIRAYFHWSFLDNFEWSEGYRLRFGLVHVDFETLVRTPKASAYWYSNLIRSGGILDFDKKSNIGAMLGPRV